jgi:hypothetical protein
VAQLSCKQRWCSSPSDLADSDPQRVAHKAVERAEVSHIRGDAENA